MDTIVDEATINITPDSMKFRAMDPSHIALIDINLPIEGSETKTFGIVVSELLKAVKRLEGDLEITIGDQMIISSGNKEYSIRTIDASEGSTPLPKLNLTTKLTSPELVRMLDDVAVISEYVQFNGEAKILNGKNDGNEVKVSAEFEGEGKAQYSLDFMRKYLKALGDVETTIEFDTKMPCKITTKDGTIAFYLAPRIVD